MLLAVVSDTHGHVANTLRAVELLDRHGVDVVIHCGDIGSAALVPLFSQWPTHFVFGNVDRERKEEIAEAIDVERQTCHRQFGSLTLAGKRIAFVHGDDRSLLESTIASGDWDLVCSGHTHQVSQSVVGRTIVLNPGALFRARTHTLALVELTELAVSIVDVPRAGRER